EAESGQREVTEAEPPEPGGGAAPPPAYGATLGLPRETALRRTPGQEGWLRESVGASLAEMDGTGAIERVSIRIVGDPTMEAAHRRWCDLEGTTDVLTFPSEDDRGIDLMLCLDEAARRSRDLEHPVEHELLLYAIHGVLHVLGHDDHDPAAFERMHAEEDRILEAIGVGPVFRRGGAS
ncbi:MAG: rRNA maturation RNase YbeY, partial [Planctomycetota bacterium]|nr:rRNA maturation RNase YbeY [Planctomycetota bacterium]